MSTIYRYLDVLSVEKCIDNINDFIKKRIFIIMSVMLCFLLFFASSKKKSYERFEKIQISDYCQ